ncbi:hypothetical protein JCM16303_001793 [Sporobolomyces ruberrimus]
MSTFAIAVQVCGSVFEPAGGRFGLATHLLGAPRCAEVDRSSNTLFHASSLPMHSITPHCTLRTLADDRSRHPFDRSDRDLAILAPVDEPPYLAPPSFPVRNPSGELVDHRTYVMTHAHITRHALCTARLLASHQAQLSKDVTVQQDFEVLNTVWNRLDTVGLAMEEAFSLLAVTGFDGVGLAVTRTILGALWLPPLLTEFAALSYLRDRVDEFGNAPFESGRSSHVPGPHWIAVESLRSMAVARSERALCMFLRYTRNRNGIYLLAARSGYLFSIRRLNELATALYHARIDNPDLFPFGVSDKLASLTFFIKSLQNAQRIYGSTVLADSIVSLSALRTRLECETCHSAELALGLFAPISFEDGATMPDIPSTCFVEAAARQLESWDFASNQVDEINAET